MKTIKWTLDAAHSEIMFKVKHLMITTVTGYFRSMSLIVETETDDFATLKSVDFTADVNSIETNNAQRDTHLKSADFFDAEKHRVLRFTGISYDISGDMAILSGELTIRGITRPERVHVKFGGIVVDPYGQTKAGFSIKTKVNRKEFGLNWNAMTEAGGIVVGDEIKVYGEIQLIRQGNIPVSRLRQSPIPEIERS